MELCRPDLDGRENPFAGDRGEAGRDSRSRTDLDGDFFGGEGEGDGDLEVFRFTLVLPEVSAFFFLEEDLLKKLGNI